MKGSFPGILDIGTNFRKKDWDCFWGKRGRGDAVSLNRWPEKGISKVSVFHFSPFKLCDFAQREGKRHCYPILLCLYPAVSFIIMVFSYDSHDFVDFICWTTIWLSSQAKLKVNAIENNEWHTNVVCNVFHDYQNLKIDKNLFSETRWDPKKTDKDNSRKSAFNILAFVYLLSN